MPVSNALQMLRVTFPVTFESKTTVTFKL